MKEQKKDNLRSLFQDMELNSLPEGFESRLMQQIHQVAAKKKAKNALRNKIFIGASIAFGMAGMIALPLIIFYFMTGNIGFELPAIQLNYSLPHLFKADINPLAVLLPSIILILLMGDTLIRKHLSDKKHHDY